MQHPSWTFEKVIDNYCKTPAAGHLYLSSSELLEWLKETANLAKTCIDAYRLPCIPLLLLHSWCPEVSNNALQAQKCNLRGDLQFFSIELYWNNHGSGTWIFCRQCIDRLVSTSVIVSKRCSLKTSIAMPETPEVKIGEMNKELLRMDPWIADALEPRFCEYSTKLPRFNAKRHGNWYFLVTETVREKVPGPGSSGEPPWKMCAVKCNFKVK